MKPIINLLGAEAAVRMFAAIGKEMPFAFANTLNGVALATQKKRQDTLGSDFTLRRPEFVKRTIYRKPREDFAIKTRLQSGVRINEDPKRDFLAKFEEGGLKTGRDGHRIAVPIDVRRNKNEVITTANRPKVLLTKKRIALVRTIIIQRLGRAKNAATRLLYVLKPSVVIPKKLGLKETGQEIMRTQFDSIAGAAIDKALRTSK